MTNRRERKAARKRLRQMMARQGAVKALPAGTALALPATVRRRTEPMEAAFYQTVGADLAKKIVAEIGSFEAARAGMDVLDYATGRSRILALCDRLARLPPLPQDVPGICERLHAAVTQTQPDSGLHEVVIPLIRFLAREARRRLTTLPFPYF